MRDPFLFIFAVIVNGELVFWVVYFDHDHRG